LHGCGGGCCDTTEWNINNISASNTGSAWQCNGCCDTTELRNLLNHNPTRDGGCTVVGMLALILREHIILDLGTNTNYIYSNAVKTISPSRCVTTTIATASAAPIPLGVAFNKLLHPAVSQHPYPQPCNTHPAWSCV
jgi:hypothetical protein